MYTNSANSRPIYTKTFTFPLNHASLLGAHAPRGQSAHAGLERHSATRALCAIAKPHYASCLLQAKSKVFQNCQTFTALPPPHAITTINHHIQNVRVQKCSHVCQSMKLLEWMPISGYAVSEYNWKSIFTIAAASDKLSVTASNGRRCDNPRVHKTDTS